MGEGRSCKKKKKRNIGYSEYPSSKFTYVEAFAILRAILRDLSEKNSADKKAIISLPNKNFHSTSIEN